MSTDWVTVLNAWAAGWGSSMWRACWQGGLLILVAGSVCRLLRWLPATVRYWLWWLACLKLVVGLFSFASIPLPLLSPSHRTVSTPTLHRAPAPPARFRGDQKEGPAVADVAARGVLTEESYLQEERRSRRSPAFDGLPSPVAILEAAWFVGFLCSLGRGAGQLASLRRLLRGTRSLEGSESCRELERLGALMALRRTPRLVQTDAVLTPLVVGPARPIVVLPERLGAVLSTAELRMTLAHELAHVRRGDLWLGWLPAFAHALFFFFPPLWLACREHATSREEACDLEALRVTGASVAGYGQLLLKIVASGTRGEYKAALGITSNFSALKRRLITIKQFPVTPAQRRLRPIATLPVILVSLLVIPWHLTARSRPALTRPAHGAGREPPGFSYTITDLGTLGGKYSHAYGINDNGQVVGCANIDPHDGEGHAFLWEPAPGSSDGRMTDLGRLTRAGRSLASGINNTGQVIVSSFHSSGDRCTFLWRRSPAYLGTLPGYRYSRALGINDRGEVVGNAQNGTRHGALVARAFLWSVAGMRDLGTLGGPYSHAYAINNRSQVVGKADLATAGAEDASGPNGTRTHAFLWQATRCQGALRDLGAFPGGRNSLACSVNDRGQVVGFSETRESIHAFLWQDASHQDASHQDASHQDASHQDVMHDLGVLPGGRASQARGINNKAQVVGWSDVDPNGAVRHAVLWENGETIDLNRRVPAGSGWVLEEARAVNGIGQIIGQGRINGRRHAFLLLPVKK